MGYGRLLKPLLEKLGKSLVEKHFVQPPVVIGGCPRSGTTLLLGALSAHPELYCLPFESRIFRKWQKDREGNPWPANIYRLYRHVLFNRIPPGKRLCEKSPVNVRYFGQIDTFYRSRVKMVHVVRDGRDVVLSEHPRQPGRSWVSVDRWVRDVRIGWDQRHKENLYTLKYEDLVSEPIHTLENLCNFLELPFTESIKDWHTHRQLTEHKGVGGALGKMRTASVRKWEGREDTPGLEAFYADERAVRLLDELGYER